MRGKSTTRWIIGIIIALLAAGGGAVAWIEYFTEQPGNVDTTSWKSLQSDYLESFDVTYTDPKMKAAWPTFKDGPWTGSISDGTYCYANTSDETSAQYNYVGIGERDISNTPTSVEVNTKNFSNSTPISAGGLLYRFDKEKAYYYAFTLSNRGVIYFYLRNADGYNVLYSGKSDSFVSGSFNKLAIIGKGSSLYLYINDSLEKIVEDEELKSGDSGIIGIGIGRHCFDNFTIYKKIDKLPGQA